MSGAFGLEHFACDKRKVLNTYSYIAESEQRHSYQDIDIEEI